MSIYPDLYNYSVLTTFIDCDSLMLDPGGSYYCLFPYSVWLTRRSFCSGVFALLNERKCHETGTLRPKWGRRRRLLSLLK